MGDNYDPVVTTNSDGVATFLYKVKGAADTTYSSTRPMAAGDYTVRASLPETGKYEAFVCTGDFTISKIDTEKATVTIDNCYVGDTYTPVVTTASDGAKTFEYKVKGTADTTYTTTKPTKAGTYTVRVTIAETDTYTKIEATDDFTISKLTTKAEVRVPDTYVGTGYEPEVTTLSTGTRTFEYKVKDAADTTYTGTKPTAAGDYTVRVMIAETDTYVAITCKGDFSILAKQVATVTVNVENTEVGTVYTPTVTCDSTGTVTWAYKVKGAADATYTGTKPTAAGDYTVRATVAETETYAELTGTADFTISRKTTTATVKVADTTVGEKYDPVLTTNSNGTATFMYKEIAADESAYTGTKPTAAGTYIVRASIPETAEYEAYVCTAYFTISRIKPTVTVNLPDVQYGTPFNPEVTTDSNGSVTIEYKRNGEPDSNYRTTPPVEIGTYSARVTVTESATYEAVTFEGTFRITAKKVATVKISVEDTVIGTDYKPVVTCESGGTITLEYKAKGAAASTYTPTKPTTAGSYTVRATVAETDTYEELTGTADFTISKISTATATVTVADSRVGDKYAPVVTCVSKGTRTFEYKVKGAADSTYNQNKPTTAGSYTVRATIQETDVYEEITCENDFTIRKRTATVKVTVADTKVGETYTPSVSTDSDGAVSFTYKQKDAGKADYSATKPTAAGTYTVRAAFAETETYEAATCTGDFTISKRTPATAAVTVSDIEVGGKVLPVVSTDSDGKGSATFVYGKTPASEFDRTVPTEAGTYTVRAIIPETDTYLSIECESTFTIRKKKATATVSLENPLAGANYHPVVTTNSDGAVTFEYKLKDADVSAYTTTQPKTPGSYVVRAKIAETATFGATSCTVEYEIGYLSHQGKAYEVEGHEGNNGFYTEDVNLQAPEGYRISATPDGTYTDRIAYTEGMTRIYLKRIADGALTGELGIGEIRIDKEAPKLLSVVDDQENTISIRKGAKVYADTLVITLEDDNLASISMGNIKQTVKDGVAEIVLAANGGIQDITMVAEDLAGNTYEISFTLLASWRKSNKVPSGISVDLTTGTGYKLDDGSWVVDGDTTGYSGQQTFYVRESRKYRITRH